MCSGHINGDSMGYSVLGGLLTAGFRRATSITGDGMSAVGMFVPECHWSDCL